jgi:hypothetical protein
VLLLDLTPLFKSCTEPVAAKDPSDLRVAVATLGVVSNEPPELVSGGGYGLGSCAAA